MNKVEELRTLLKSKIDRKEIRQNALGRSTGVDQASINRFYQENSGLSAENFIKIAQWAGWIIGPPTKHDIRTSSSIESTVVCATLKDELEKERLINVLEKQVSLLEDYNSNLKKQIADFERRFEYMQGEGVPESGNVYAHIAHGPATPAPSQRYNSHTDDNEE